MDRIIMAIQSCAVYVVLLQQKEVPGSAAADGPHSPDASRAYGPILIRSGPPMVPLCRRGRLSL